MTCDVVSLAPQAQRPLHWLVPHQMGGEAVARGAIKERCAHESADVCVMALKVAKPFFVKNGYTADALAERLLHEMYDPFHEAFPEDIFHVNWSPTLTVKMLYRHLVT